LAFIIIVLMIVWSWIDIFVLMIICRSECSFYDSLSFDNNCFDDRLISANIFSKTVWSLITIIIMIVLSWIDIVVLMSIWSRRMFFCDCLVFDSNYFDWYFDLRYTFLFESSFDLDMFHFYDYLIFNRNYINNYLI